MKVELAALRKQIAMLVMAQESSMVTDKTGEVECKELPDVSCHGFSSWYSFVKLNCCITI